MFSDLQLLERTSSAYATSIAMPSYRHPRPGTIAAAQNSSNHRPPPTSQVAPLIRVATTSPARHRQAASFTPWQNSTPAHIHIGRRGFAPLPLSLLSHRICKAVQQSSPISSSHRHLDSRHRSTKHKASSLLSGCRSLLRYPPALQHQHLNMAVITTILSTSQYDLAARRRVA